MRLFIVTGISGSGKTTVTRRLLELGYTALDSKLNQGLFYFVDENGSVPASNHPNDPSWKARHRWVIDQNRFDELTRNIAFSQCVFLCGGGDSLKALWSQAEKVFLLKVDANTL